MIDTFWILFCASLVFMQQAGFLCLESGLTRQKNNINVALKNLCDAAVVFLTFFIVVTIFDLDYFQSPSNNDSQSSLNIALLIYHCLFCCTAVTLVSGAIAERVAFSAYLLMAVVVSILIYPPIAHWVWSSNGWLNELGFYDFAGAAVVHCLGGSVALALVIIIGPRYERFTIANLPIPPSNLAMATLGASILWFGWIGFNGGSFGEFNNQVPTIFLTTFLGACSGTAFLVMYFSFIKQKMDVARIISACLGGLVSVTGCAPLIEPIHAIWIGAIGGFITYLFHHLLIRQKIDDPVGAIEVHLGGGLWGCLVVIPFSSLTIYDALFNQLIGITVVVTWSFGIAYLTFFSINKFFPLRISKEIELVGLNISEHGASNELSNLLSTMQSQKESGDLSLRATEEPHTEVGKIAKQYNELLGSLEEKEAHQLDAKNAAEATSKVLSNLINEIEAKNQELVIAQQSAEKANTAKTVFLTKVGHELRTPLNAIIGFANRASKKNKDDSLNACLHNIHAAGESLLGIINGVIDVAAIESGNITLKKTNINPQKEIQSVVGLCIPLAKEKHLTLEINELCKFPVQAYGDANRLKQLFFNLMCNAIKFTPDGKVSVEITFEDLDDHYKIIYSVKDTGIGIAETDLVKIFKPFRQVDESTARQYEGNGIGLSIAKEITRLMQGELKVESTLGLGSNFYGSILLAKISD